MSPARLASMVTAFVMSSILPMTETRIVGGMEILTSGPM